MASRTRSINLEDMTHKAARIFSGRCLEARPSYDPALNMDVTLIRFETERVVKGPQERIVTLRVAGRAVEGASGREFIGMPAFRVGEEVVIFLYGESRAGLSSPVGLGQGKFILSTGKDGRRYAVNNHKNLDLFHGLSPDATRRLDAAARATGRRVAPAWDQGGDLPVDTLLDLAAALSR